MAVERVYGGTSLIDVLDRILDKGLVIDVWARVSVVGLEVLTVEARVVVASVDTYLRYAQAIGLTPLAARPPVEQGEGALAHGQGGQRGNGSRPLEGVNRALQGVAGQLGGGEGGQGDSNGQYGEIARQLRLLIEQLESGQQQAQPLPAGGAGQR